MTKHWVVRGTSRTDIDECDLGNCEDSLKYDDQYFAVVCVAEIQSQGFSIESTCSGLYGFQIVDFCKYKTYNDASSYCENNPGGRLPTKEEVKNGCIDNHGCLSENLLIWTSSEDSKANAFSREKLKVSVFKNGQFSRHLIFDKNFFFREKHFFTPIK